MRTVKQLLEGKPAEVIAVEPDQPVFDAVRKMDRHGVGAVLVMRGEVLVGILSERDYARKVVLLERSSHTTRADQIMTAQVVTVEPQQTVKHCMEVMTQRRFRHLPVVEEGRVIGVISIGDLVKAVIEEQQADLDALQRYIAS
ncbi:CBS domain-containing protein [Pseudoxanthomonas sp. GM95]|uniref:CBS domain-containing protein n=1 Tax=Pseudoxanthomonas sp. GM95 TaxID=1881043 RepID=UPI0008CDB047|nr:CBS domain-containing protein [Pseudoxanthomonas sp. GM95]SEL69863.1 CBS domain-containing protein [Pseudoxanthomonas sp. GM95]